MFCWEGKKKPTGMYFLTTGNFSNVNIILRQAGEYRGGVSIFLSPKLSFILSSVESNLLKVHSLSAGCFWHAGIWCASRSLSSAGICHIGELLLCDLGVSFIYPGVSSFLYLPRVTWCVVRSSSARFSVTNQQILFLLGPSLSPVSAGL